MRTATFSDTATSDNMDASLRYLLDRTQIVETIIRYFNALDDRDFVALRSTLADTIEVDFWLLSGKAGEVHDADTFTASVSKSLSSSPRTQHISANHVVTIDGDQAEATASLYAWHEAKAGSDSIGTLRGAYTIGLARGRDGWRLDKLRMKALWARPDKDVHLTEAHRD